MNRFVFALLWSRAAALIVTRYGALKKMYGAKVGSLVTANPLDRYS